MVRPARAEDAGAAAPLLAEANGSLAEYLAGTRDRAEVLAFLEGAFRAPANRLSHENALVLEHDANVAGVLVAYPGRRAAELDRPLEALLAARTRDPNARLARECRPEDHYLDSLAVAAAKRGLGLGRELVLAFEARAAALGERRLALLVEPDNLPALGLYGSLGYEDDGPWPIGPYRFRRLVKRLWPSSDRLVPGA